jgi:hypothetical protein
MNRYRKKVRGITRILFSGVLYGAVLWNVRAMDWPTSETSLVENFGAVDKGSLSLGYSFEGESVVRAAETGELLFIRENSDSSLNASRLPSPLGSWVAIDHGDGLISMYSRLDEGRIPSLPKSIIKESVIGSTGVSGWTSAKGFHFSLFDRKERRWVNPGMVISRLLDARAPTVQSVILRSPLNRAIDLAQTKSIGQGTYTVFVTAFDFMPSNEAALAPFRIMCLLNGREIGVVVFETFFAKDGILWIYRNGPSPVKQVYGSAPALEIGEAGFARGQATLEVVVQDMNENTYSAVYRFSVE